MSFVSTCTSFVFPALLPTSPVGVMAAEEGYRAGFVDAEDFLIALAMERMQDPRIRKTKGTIREYAKEISEYSYSVSVLSYSP